MFSSECLWMHVLGCRLATVSRRPPCTEPISLSCPNETSNSNEEDCGDVRGVVVLSRAPTGCGGLHRVKQCGALCRVWPQGGLATSTRCVPVPAETFGSQCRQWSTRSCKIEGDMLHTNRSHAAATVLGLVREKMWRVLGCHTVRARSIPIQVSPQPPALFCPNGEYWLGAGQNVRIPALRTLYCEVRMNA